MSKMHLKQPECTYITCGPFTENKDRIKKLKKQEIQEKLKNKLDKACFQHDMVHGDFKDLNRRTAADKVLLDKAFNIAKNQKYDGYQRGLASIVYKCFDKKTSGRTVKNEIMSNKELAEELHKPIIRKLEKRKVHSPFIDNIWEADLADMQLISKCNKKLRFLSCVIDIYSKYAWVIPLKDKKGITIINAFHKMLDESNRKPNKTWVDKISEFYNRLMESFLQNDDTEMYSTHNEGKSVITERFIRI